MGTENRGHPSFPGQPVSTPFSSSQPPAVFSSTRPVGGRAPSAFRPVPPPPPNTNPNPYPSACTVATGSGLENSQPPSQYAFNGPSLTAPPSSYLTPTYGTLQRPNAPQYPTVPQAFTPGLPPSQPTTGQLYSQPGSFCPPAQVPTVPMGSPPSRGNIVTPGTSVLTGSPFNLGSSTYPGARPSAPPTLPVFPNQQPPTVLRAPTSQTFRPPFAIAQGGYPAAPSAPPPPTPLVGVLPGIQRRPQGP